MLVRRLSQIGLVDRIDGPRLQKDLTAGQRLVSTEGDMWRWDGLRTSADDSPSATALVLAQRNRLERLTKDLNRVQAALDAARSRHGRCFRHLKRNNGARRQGTA